MNDDKTTIELMKQNIGSLKGGTLRFWGEWFGRPMDNYHTIFNVQYEQEKDTLVIIFDSGEILTVWNPVDINCISSKFYIRNATKVRWEWFSYGQPHTQQNLCHIQYEKRGNSIVISNGKGTLDYIRKGIVKSVGQHAVEIC